MSGTMSAPAFPRRALIGAGVLIGATLIAVAAVRVVGPVSTIPPSTPVAEREFRFQDHLDGSIDVIDARTGRRVLVVAPASDYFLRGTLRGLASERKREDLGADTPFRLTRWADGRLTLADPATGHSVELESFGPTNEAAFARLMTANGEAP